MEIYEVKRTMLLMEICEGPRKGSRVLKDLGATKGRRWLREVRKVLGGVWATGLQKEPRGKKSQKSPSKN